MPRALDKSLFCGDRPFSQVELAAQADAGAAAFLAVYGREIQRSPARRAGQGRAGQGRAGRRA